MNILNLSYKGKFRSFPATKLFSNYIKKDEMTNASLLKVWQWKKDGMSSKIGPDRGACDKMKQAADRHIGPHYDLVSDMDGDQCMRIACSVYFQQRLPDEFYKVQLLLNYRSLKQLNPDHCYRSSLINIIKIGGNFFKRNFVFESVKHFNGKRRNM